jgi:hypothetical protein
MSAFRSDGLDNPFSPNGLSRATWDRVWQRCEESIAVRTYDPDTQTIWWDGESESQTFSDPQAALIAIRQMEAV